MSAPSLAGVPLVFLDTETTSLHRRTRRIWDIAAIRRNPDGYEATFAAIVADVDLTHADPRSLAVGRFYTRHPAGRLPSVYRLPGQEQEPPAPGYFPTPQAEADIARELERLTRGAHLVGAVPSFDEETLDDMLRRHGHAPAWHYHLIDIEALAAGRLGVAPPWNSRELSLEVGVDSAGFDVHTALGDAQWAMAVFDAVVGRGRDTPTALTGVGAAFAHPTTT